MNPYLFIGAPIMVVTVVSLGIPMVEKLAWSNALLIIIGRFRQKFQKKFREFYISKSVLPKPKKAFSCNNGF